MSRGVGFRAFKNIERPAKEVIELFRGIPVANIADNMNRLYCVDTAIRPMNKRPVLGCAFTVKVSAGDNLMIHKALHMAKPGDIIVVDGCGYLQRSLMGEIMFTQMKVLGLGGLIVDGAIRDVDCLENFDMPVYARGVTPRGPYKHGYGEVNVPVCIGGQVVMPGDIIVGDMDGIVVIRPEDAFEIADLGKKHNQKEEAIFADLKKGVMDTAWIEKTTTEKGIVIFD